jgi:hypothetical protein
MVLANLSGRERSVVQGHFVYDPIKVVASGGVEPAEVERRYRGVKAGSKSHLR